MTPRVYLAAYRDGMSTRYQEVGPEDMGAEEWQRVERPDLKPGELLPCPFCGSPAPRYHIAWGIRCTACDASIPCFGDDFGPWNRRAALDLTTEPEPTSGWQPIETAPRDGTWFRARTAGGTERFVHFGDRYDRYPVSHDGEVWSTAPVEWAPVNPVEEDPDCACCGGTGITFQTERRCACQPPLPASTPTSGAYDMICCTAEDVVQGRGFTGDAAADLATAQESLRVCLALLRWRG